ncbi:MAG: DUF1636 domain-containing protein [Pseudomonadota bacterium]
MDDPLPETELLVCTTCRYRGEVTDDDRRPGEDLLAALSAGDVPANLRITPVKCLSNCDHGCTVVLRGAGRWTYVYGNLDARTDAAMLLDGARRYAGTTDGLVPWRARPEHFRKNCIARVPPLEDAHG